LRIADCGLKKISIAVCETAIPYGGFGINNPLDLCVYHLGNNPYHEYIYDRAIQTPGLLVLHEHCLRHLIAWKTLRRGDEGAYRDEMFYGYGRRGARSSGCWDKSRTRCFWWSAKITRTRASRH
jgi:hypothetical protein